MWDEREESIRVHLTNPTGSDGIRWAAAAPEAGDGCGWAQAAAGRHATFKEHVPAPVSLQDLLVGTDLSETLFTRFVDAGDTTAPALLLVAVKRPRFPGFGSCFSGVEAGMTSCGPWCWDWDWGLLLGG